jgi:hypothetical protein
MPHCSSRCLIASHPVSLPCLKAAKSFPRSNVSYQDFLDWRERNRVFSSIAAWGADGFLLKTTEGVQSVPGIRVCDAFFQTLAVNMLLGRDFQPADDIPGAPRTLVGMPASFFIRCETTLLAVAVVLLVCSLAAAFFPARRAAVLDPAAVLRSQ